MLFSVIALQLNIHDAVRPTFAGHGLTTEERTVQRRDVIPLQPRTHWSSASSLIPPKA